MLRASTATPNTLCLNCQTPARSLAGRGIVASLPEHKFLLADLSDAAVTLPLGNGGLEPCGEVLTRPWFGL
jgi:hypothetical protein